MPSKSTLLLRGSVLRTVHLLFTIITSLFLMPFILRSLGDDLYGLWILVGSFVDVYWIFDAGMGSALQRYLSRALARDEKREANVVVNTTLAIYAALSPLVILFSVLASFFVPFLVKNPALVQTAEILVVFLGIDFAIALPIRAISGILPSYMRFDLQTIIILSKDILRILLVVVFLSLGYKIWALAFISVGLNIVFHVVVWIVSFKVAKGITLKWHYVELKRIPHLFSYSVNTFIIQVADKLRFNIDSFVISPFLGLAYVTLYSIAQRIVDYSMQICQGSMGVFMPLFSNFEGQGKEDLLQKTFLLLTKISSYVSIFLAGSIVIFGAPFIERWVGQEYLAAYRITLVLLAGHVLAGMQLVSIQLLFGISKHSFFAIVNTYEGIINLILSIILVQKIGIAGVALGTVIPMIFVKVFIQPFYVCRQIKISAWKYLGLLAVCILRGSVILTVYYLIFSPLILPQYRSILPLGILSFIFYVLAICFWEWHDTAQRNFVYSCFPILYRLPKRLRHFLGIK